MVFAIIKILYDTHLQNPTGTSYQGFMILSEAILDFDSPTRTKKNGKSLYVE